jgi:hypothetical protein
MTPRRCSDLSREAREPLFATATTATRWLLVEVGGTWPRDVSAEDALSAPAREAVDGWLARTSGSKVLFVRRPGRAGGRCLAFVVRSEESAMETRRFQLASHAELATVDLDRGGDPVEGSLVLVCGHGTRDACCALRGTAVFGALAPTMGGEELWLSSHHGGHRFAANLLVLPGGLQFGRVEPEEASSLVSLGVAGRIELDRYRGRTCYEPPVQAAERAVRTTAGLDGVGDLRLLGTDGLLVRFKAGDGAEYRASVERREGPVTPASCGAPPEPQHVLTARVV